MRMFILASSCANDNTSLVWYRKTRLQAVGRFLEILEVSLCRLEVRLVLRRVAPKQCADNPCREKQSETCKTQCFENIPKLWTERLAFTKRSRSVYKCFALGHLCLRRFGGYQTKATSIMPLYLYKHKDTLVVQRKRAPVRAPFWSTAEMPSG